MLVTLEGIDGSGKTTVWEKLQESFPDAVFTREPTESWYGDAVRRSIADDKAEPLAELFLYTADHADHLARVVQPALAQGELVISDRFADSRYAYQSATIDEADGGPARSITDSLEFVQSIHQPFTIRPDLTLYFDVDAETGAERSGAITKFEQVEFLQSVRSRYEQLIEEAVDRITRIDAGRSKDAVLNESIAEIKNARAETQTEGEA